MKNLLNKAKNKVQEIVAVVMAKDNVAAVMAKDNGGKEIIVELGLAAIAVALLMVYRGQINTLVTGIMTQAKTTIGNLFTISLHCGTGVFRCPFLNGRRMAG